MKKKIIFISIFLAIGFIAFSCYSYFKNNSEEISTNEMLTYCDIQVKKTLSEIENNLCKLPRSIYTNEKKWSTISPFDWTSGFWPGILWYNYENTQNEYIKQKAMYYTDCLTVLLNPEHKGDHDLGFQFFCSFVNGYRLTKNEKYKEYALKGADKLAGFFNPKVGTMLSWAHMVDKMNWPHNTIMDNMMNLELLFWASKNGGKSEYYDMAERHAHVTMHNQFREDYTNYHVAIYDTINGNLIKCVTNQGIHNESFWARGQAWAIYGYTMVYRETGNKEFLRFVEKVADVYLARLPEDHVPYWDFDDPAIPKAPKDASSTSIVASALLELASLEDNPRKSKEYYTAAEKMIKSLSSENYISGNSNSAFILHSTGNYPAGYEIDTSINYADYYYIEALTRYKRLNP